MFLQLRVKIIFILVMKVLNKIYESNVTDINYSVSCRIPIINNFEMFLDSLLLKY